MALEKVGKLLAMADEARTSIIAFECSDYNMVYAAAAAAERTGKPIIIMVDPFTCIEKNVSNPASFAGIAKGILERFSVPMGLHLDHSSDYRYIMEAIRSGFPSVMFDGSGMPLKENILMTRKVVESADVFGVEVEAELGRVGFAANGDEDDHDLYTRPEVAAHFCEMTGVASLAIAIGSAHGVYKDLPRLDIERLGKINAATDVPLVLHGGSGIPDDQLVLAFQNGINKFNVGTEYFQVYYRAVEDFCAQNKSDTSWDRRPMHILDLPAFVQERMIEYVEKKLDLCKLELRRKPR